jgi:hypothetical protein
MILAEIKTCDLVDELSRREAVQKIGVHPYEKFSIDVNGKRQDVEIESGPCWVFVIWD